MRRIRLPLALLVAFASIAVPRQVAATHAYDSRPHWMSADPSVTVKIVDSVTRRWDRALRDGAADWSVSPEVDMRVTKSSTSNSVRKSCGFTPDAIHVCNYGYGSSQGWAGLAEFDFSNNGHILRARIRLNESTTGGVAPDVRRAIACHELGHTLGLGHYRDPQPPDSCMRTPSRPGGPEDPSAHDYGEIAVGYGHIDRLVPTSSGGTTNVYDESDPNLRVRRDGDITHVTWILPAS